VADIVEQRGESNVAVLCQAAGQVIRAERMLEPGMRGPGIDEEGMAELPHVSQALKRRRVDHGHSLGLEADVIPKRVANDLERQTRASGLGPGA
jgi:hypothetical protein